VQDHADKVPDDIFRDVVESSIDGLIVIDVDGIVRFANPAAVKLFEGKTSQLIGFELGSPAILQTAEIIVTSRAGMRIIEMRSTEIAWNGKVATLASLRDITEHRKSQDALLAAAESLSERNTELMRFNQQGVGRELRMLELKEEVNELCLRLGEPPRHRIAGTNFVPPIDLVSNL
jgi:nitrogen-specific signal transduction histidine kinase